MIAELYELRTIKDVFDKVNEVYPNWIIDILDDYKQFEKEWSEKWFSFIIENPDKPWNWYNLSQNRNITWDIIQNNPEKLWDFYYISDNTFTKEKEEFIRQKFREHFMGKGFGYDKTSLFRELMERVWSPENLEKFDYRMLET